MTTLTVNNRMTQRFFSFCKKFLYSSQTLKYILTYLNSIENIIILFCHSFLNH